MPSLYEITVPVFIAEIKILQKILAKGVAYANLAESKVSEQDLLDARLVADMQNFIYQIQRLSDTAKGLAVRVGKVENVVLSDDEKTFADLQARLAKTVEVLESVKPEDINAAEEAEVVMKTQAGEHKFTGNSYVLTFAIPNFYFHFVAAYALLRKEGVPIGKGHYLGIRDD